MSLILKKKIGVLKNRRKRLVHSYFLRTIHNN